MLQEYYFNLCEIYNYHILSIMKKANANTRTLVSECFNRLWNHAGNYIFSSKKLNILYDSYGIRTHNHLVRKRTLDHLENSTVGRNIHEHSWTLNHWPVWLNG